MGLTAKGPEASLQLAGVLEEAARKIGKSAMSKAMTFRQAPTHLPVRKDAPKTKFSIRADVKTAEAMTESA